MRLLSLLSLLSLPLLSACGHRIPDPGTLPLSRSLGPMVPPERVCWVEFAQGNLPHGIVVAHNALKADVTSTQSGLLLVDPRGSWLIDGGSALDYQAQIREVPLPARLFLQQAARGWTDLQPSAAVVTASGFSPDRLTGMIATHGHFDHLGGLADIPAVPVWMPQPEIDLLAQSAGKHPTILPGDARRLTDRVRPVAWEDKPFLAWERSWDLYGDGSVVVLDTPGHTPGSLSVYVTLSDGRRTLLVGDTVWVREGFELREPKGALAASFDADREGTDEQIARLWSLHQQDPGLAILPAHDRRSWAELFGTPGCVHRGVSME